MQCTFEAISQYRYSLLVQNLNTTYNSTFSLFQGCLEDYFTYDYISIKFGNLQYNKQYLSIYNQYADSY